MFKRALPTLTPLAAPALLALCALLAACATDPAPAPVVARVAATPTPVPTPAPSEYVDVEAYLFNNPAEEKVPAALTAATDQLRAIAIQRVFSDSDSLSREVFRQARVCFIAVGANRAKLQDPSVALLSGIKSAGLPVKKFSECVVDGQGVRDLASGARGVLVKVCRICWAAPGHALVEYGYSIGGIKGKMTMAEARLNGGEWVFEERKITSY